jgi:pilus assembly protein CpaB
MDRRFLTVLGVSLVFALVVSSVFYQMTARSGGPKKVEATDQKDVVVATRPLGVGWMIKPADVKIEKVPTEAFPKGAFTKVEDVLDRPVISRRKAAGWDLRQRFRSACAPSPCASTTSRESRASCSPA